MKCWTVCRVLTDTETEVQYLFVSTGYKAGLTPLIDENGKPLVNEMLKRTEN